MTDEDGGIYTQELICIERPAGTTERIKERKICVKRGVLEALFKALGLGWGEGHVMKQCMQHIYDDDGILLYTVHVEGLALRAKKLLPGKPHLTLSVVSRPGWKVAFSFSFLSAKGNFLFSLLLLDWLLPPPPPPPTLFRHSRWRGERRNHHNCESTEGPPTQKRKRRQRFARGRSGIE